jgi:hypothetical protein
LPKDEIIIEVPMKSDDLIKRKWKVEIESSAKININQAREKYI